MLIRTKRYFFLIIAQIVIYFLLLFVIALSDALMYFNSFSCIYRNHSKPPSNLDAVHQRNMPVLAKGAFARQSEERENRVQHGTNYQPCLFMTLSLETTRTMMLHS